MLSLCDDDALVIDDTEVNVSTIAGIASSVTQGLPLGGFSALRKLSRNKNLVLLRPDKCNGIVILDKPDYISNVELLLSDVSKFKRLDGMY